MRFFRSRGLRGLQGRANALIVDLHRALDGLGCKRHESGWLSLKMFWKGREPEVSLRESVVREVQPQCRVEGDALHSVRSQQIQTSFSRCSARRPSLPACVCRMSACSSRRRGLNLRSCFRNRSGVVARYRSVDFPFADIGSYLELRRAPGRLFRRMFLR